MYFELHVCYYVYLVGIASPVVTYTYYIIHDYVHVSFLNHCTLHFDQLYSVVKFQSPRVGLPQ